MSAMDRQGFIKFFVKIVLSTRFHKFVMFLSNSKLVQVMSNLYTKLQEIGHGRVEAAPRVFNYTIGDLMPLGFPRHEPVELLIE